MAESVPRYAAPAPLSAAHDCAEFRSGEPALDEWLRERALSNTELGASKTYVICAPDTSRVIGFYALCMGQILGLEATGAMRRNMPRHIPAVILARFAIDQEWQGQGFGQALLYDVTVRSLRAAQEIAARLLIVHAISPAAEAFYLRQGFQRLPVEIPTFALDLVRLQKVHKPD